MKDTIVSIRMPKDLADQLPELAKQNHFLDSSDMIRSIIRKKWLESTSPESNIIQIKKELEQTKEQKKILLEKLKEIMEQL